MMPSEWHFVKTRKTLLLTRNGLKSLRFPTKSFLKTFERMEKYKLVFKKSVSRDLLALPKRDIARILKCIQALAEEPRPPGCEKLSGLDRYRVRQGAYRIIY